MFHVALVFGWTFYLEIGAGSFARLSFALSQSIIFSFATFSLVYVNVMTNRITHMIENMNRNFKFRSAKGMFALKKKKEVEILFWL